MRFANVSEFIKLEIGGIKEIFNITLVFLIFENFKMLIVHTMNLVDNAFRKQ